MECGPVLGSHARSLPFRSLVVVMSRCLIAWSEFRHVALVVGSCLIGFPALSFCLYVGSVKQTNAGGDCPVAIDLNGNGRIDVTGHTPTAEKLYTISSIRNFVSFDVDGDGNPEKIDWIKANTDGLIVEWNPAQPKAHLTGLDLMGLDRVYADGSTVTFKNGFEKLASFDANLDGKI